MGGLNPAPAAMNPTATSRAAPDGGPSSPAPCPRVAGRSLAAGHWGSIDMDWEKIREQRRQARSGIPTFLDLDEASARARGAR